ncbi:hypothetical protein DY000_02009685 [Brassica cretica]|uniref:Uncharacterized protein n=1 Tax=Brassica cretica TaxID=69181 RepID=A0ABQ7C3Y6_BRACR|nr:hypothetical protein DY000_02009685 [Brassica cretica]
MHLLQASAPLTPSRSNENLPLTSERVHHAPFTRLRTTVRPNEPYKTRSYSEQPVTPDPPPHTVDLTPMKSEL